MEPLIVTVCRFYVGQGGGDKRIERTKWNNRKKNEQKTDSGNREPRINISSRCRGGGGGL